MLRNFLMQFVKDNPEVGIRLQGTPPIPCYVREWIEPDEGCDSDILVVSCIEADEVLYIPTGAIVAISILPVGKLQELRRKHSLNQRAEALQMRQVEEQLDQAEGGGRRVAPAVQMPPGTFNR